MTMAPEELSVTEVKASVCGNEDARCEAAAEQFGARFHLGFDLGRRGFDFASLSSSELDVVEAAVRERLSPIFDDIVERWQDEHGTLTERDKIDRELRRQVTDEKDAIATYYGDWECESCGWHNGDSAYFVDFHGMLLCDGCLQHARDRLRDLQRPLVEALEAEPTLEHARALGFELTHRQRGRLVWVSEDDEYDGGSAPYADEQEALEGLVAELT